MSQSSPVRPFQGILLLLACLAFLAGCRSAPAERLVTIPEEVAQKMIPAENDEFDLSWTDRTGIRNCRKVKIEIAEAPELLPDTWWDRVNIVNVFYSDREQLENLAAYARQALTGAFAGSGHLQPVEEADSETMTLRFVIVQAIPNKPVLGALNNLSSLTPFGAMAIPLKMTIHSLTPSSGGAVAAEILLTAPDGACIGALADRAKAPTAIFSFHAFTPYWNIESIIDRWSESIAAGLDSIHEEREPRFVTMPAFALLY